MLSLPSIPPFSLFLLPSSELSGYTDSVSNMRPLSYRCYTKIILETRSLTIALFFCLFVNSPLVGLQILQTRKSCFVKQIYEFCVLMPIGRVHWLMTESYVSLPVLVSDELVRTSALTPCWKVPRRRRACLFRIMFK